MIACEYLKEIKTYASKITVFRKAQQGQLVVMGWN